MGHTDILILQIDFSPRRQLKKLSKSLGKIVLLKYQEVASKVLSNPVLGLIETNPISNIDIFDQFLVIKHLRNTCNILSPYGRYPVIDGST